MLEKRPHDRVVAEPRQTVRAVVLADTHVSTREPHPRGSVRGLAAQLWQRLAQADLILHAGDILDQGLLDELASVAPVHAVLGNNDRTLRGVLDEVLDLEVAGVPLGMVHDSGPRAGRAHRLRRMFPNAHLVIFGHSHVPVDEAGDDGQLLFNPGSATLRRSQPACTFGEIVFSDGAILSRAIIEIERPSA